jgi:hypothetical protein
LHSWKHGTAAHAGAVHADDIFYAQFHALKIIVVGLDA